MKKHARKISPLQALFLVLLVSLASVFAALFQFDDAAVGQFRAPSGVQTGREGVQPVVQSSQAAPQEPAVVSDEKIIYVYGVGLAVRKDATGLVYQHQDYLSSNRFATDSTGKLVSRQVQEPYGTTFDETGTGGALANDYTFTGKERDDSLYYYGARYYDPRTGRVVSVDPLTNADESAYAYAGNNPVGFVDPDGRVRVASSWRPPTWNDVRTAFAQASAWQNTPLSGAMMVNAVGSLISMADPYGFSGVVGAGVIATTPAAAARAATGYSSLTSMLKKGTASFDEIAEIFRNVASRVNRGRQGEVRRVGDVAIKHVTTAELNRNILDARTQFKAMQAGESAGSSLLPKPYQLVENIDETRGLAPSGEAYMMKEFVEGEAISILSEEQKIAVVNLEREFYDQTGWVINYQHTPNVIQSPQGSFHIVDFWAQNGYPPDYKGLNILFAPTGH